MSREINIKINDVTLDDIEGVFAPIGPDEEWFEFNSGESMPQILKAIGIFKSTSQASKSGWREREVPQGFHSFTIGKLKHEISIFNPTNNPGSCNWCDWCKSNI